MSDDWIEYAKLGIAALTPIMTLAVGIIVGHLGTKLANASVPSTV